MEKRTKDYVYSWAFTLYIVCGALLGFILACFDFNIAGILMYGGVYLLCIAGVITVIYGMRRRGEFILVAPRKKEG